MKILFISATPLGDGILSTAVMNQLRTIHPNARFTVACGPLPAPLFEVMPDVDHVIIFKRGPLLGHWRRLLTQTWNQHWDLVVDLRGSLLGYLIAPTRTKRWTKALRGADHKVQQLCRITGLPVANPSVPVPNKLRDSINKRLHVDLNRPIIALGLTSSWGPKEWPLEHFMTLGDMLLASDKAFGTRPILLPLSGPGAERERVLPFIEHFAPHDIIDGAGTLSVPEVAALLSESKGFIGNDSGLMHLSAALNRPTLGLFGPSPDHIYGPWGEQTAVLRTKESWEIALQKGHKGENIMGEISVKETFQKFHQLLKVLL